MIFELAQRALAPVKAAPRLAPWARRFAEGQRYAMPDYSLADNQAKAFQALSWVNTAVQMTANVVALQGFNVYELQGEKRVEVDNHKFELLLMDPNPNMSRFDLMSATIGFRKVTGSCYWWLNRPNENTPPTEIWVIPTNRIVPIPDGRLWVRGYLYDPGNGQEALTIPPYQILQFRNWHPRNEFVGLSDIEALAIVLETDQKTQKYLLNYYSEDNAKFPGVLAFEEYIDQTNWDRIQEEFKQSHGGVRQSLRMLRGVGAGGIKWIQTNMSHRDMELLNSRGFTKEEVFDQMAPGLAQMLSVNATEANSVTGKKTFMDMCVWPQLVHMAEKMNQILLPLYAQPNQRLIGEFDDPRIVDRAMELEEQDRFGMVHTVDEARDKYYGDKPLGDERGNLLVAEVGKSFAPFGQQANAQANQQSNAAEAGAAQENTDQNATKALAIREGELHTWRRYAVKHGAVKAVSFAPKHLPGDVSGVIRDRLKAAITAEEVSAAFSGPFLVKAERVTDGGEIDPNAESKDVWEGKLKRLLAARLDGQLDAIMEALGDPPNIYNLDAAFWNTQTGLMIADLRPLLEQMALEAATRVIVGDGVGISWDQAAEAAARWAERYSYELVTGITNTTQRMLSRKMSQFIREPGRTIGDLSKDLEPYFGKVRADMIAITETTNAFSGGERDSVAIAQQMGFRLEPIWHTCRDELVCNLCAPRDGKVITDGMYPSLHPRCRCWVTHRWVE